VEDRTVVVKYLSVCSGIEAATNAWHGLGWEPVAFSEIDPFASAVLAARFPNVPNLGDLEKYREWNIAPGSVDVVVGGTPCQSFSVAGLRKGLDDPRGNLALVYLGLVDRLRPRWVVWENVPGVLSVDGGRAFGSFLGGLAQLGYGFAYRVLDAQYVRVESHPRAVPQRRRRVFVVGCAGGDWRSAAEVLLEPEGVFGNSPPRREAGKETARGARPGAASGGIEAVGFEPRYYLRDNKTGGAPADTSALTASAWKAGDNSPHVAVVHAVAGTVASKWSKGTGGPAGDECQNLVPMRPATVAPTLSTAWGDRHPGTSNQDWISQHGGLFVPAPLPFDTTQVTSALNRSNPQHGDPCHPLTRGGAAPSVAFAQNQRQELRTLEVAGAIGAIRRGDAKNETLLATPAFPWPVDVADPITANEGATYTHEGTTFRMHNVVPDAVIRFQSNLGSQGGDVFDGISTVVRRDAPPAVAFTTRGRADGLSIECQEELAYALTNPGSGGRANSRMVMTPAVAFSCKDYGGDASVELAPTMRAMPHDGSHPNGGGQLAVAAPVHMINFQGNKSGSSVSSDGTSFTLNSMHGHDVHVVAAAIPIQDGRGLDKNQNGLGVGAAGDPAYTLDTSGAQAIGAVAAPTLTSANDPSRSPQSSEVTQQVAAVHTATMAVRRLTPRECERLQGFPDDWTAITYRGKPAADGPRYKALGNSMAVNVMRWIGERIAMRTGRRFAPVPADLPENEDDVSKRDLGAETEEMNFVAQEAATMPLDTPEDVKQFQVLLEELRERKQGIIDALNAFETAEDAILDALDRSRRAS
jgi:DNA (cytosine-5)-methyltransferase 1